ncbi:PHD finger protein ALFIN-LIKE 6-like [Andrographis paniculata]|uniref:PHD finger protein ALFIN-LIKE 6-like n=1 Tax=Andrographis paniculata TaxID=175694 RepID=UPI0021E92F35|nr:PHD finger protein ALFIN-LIKE 6-like [Andrographis paniculata]
MGIQRGTSPPISMNMYEVFNDFKGRRAALIKALTTDSAKFFQECDPAQENLCLYGLPNETWRVHLPAEEVPPDIPEPALGINFSRDGMPKRDWLLLVAVHSDSWLLSVAFFFASKCEFDKNERTMLFQMINDLPTVYEAVMESCIPTISQAAAHNDNNNSQSSREHAGTKRKNEAESPPTEEDDDDGVVEEFKDEDEAEAEAEATLCGACGNNYDPDGFWICCDICEKWFHGKCVKITPARAVHIKQYSCPDCSRRG